MDGARRHRGEREPARGSPAGAGEDRGGEAGGETVERQARRAEAGESPGGGRTDEPVGSLPRGADDENLDVRRMGVEPVRSGSEPRGSRGCDEQPTSTRHGKESALARAAHPGKIAAGTRGRA